LLGSVLDRRYRVHTLVGRGAQGLVVEAAGLATGKAVVLKLLPLPPGLTQERFVWRVREATALAHFEHQNVEPVFDFGSLPEGGMFLVRNHVTGTPLRLALRQGRMPVNRVIQIGRQLAHALTSAHTREIVHGRLKPENVLLSQHADGTDSIKLVDFAIGTPTSSVASIAYASEDQRALALRTRLYWPATYDGSAPAQPHIDLYSLGVVLYEMIAGQPPILFDTTELGLQPPRPAPTFAQCSPPVSVPKPVEDVVLTLLHPDLARRGPTAEQVFGALDALLSGRTPAATHTPSSVMPAVAGPRTPSPPPPAAQAPSALGNPRPAQPGQSQRAPMPPSRRRPSADQRGPVPAPPSAPLAAPPPGAWPGAPAPQRAPAAPSQPAWVPAAAPASWAPGHVINAGPIGGIDFNPSGAPPPAAVKWPDPPAPSPEALLAKTWPPASAGSPLAAAAAQMSGPSPLNRAPAPPPARVSSSGSPPTWPPPAASGPNSWLPPSSGPATRPAGPPGGTWPPGSGGLPAGGVPTTGYAGPPAGGVPPPRSGPPPYPGPGSARPSAPFSSPRGAPTLPPSNGPISIPRPSMPSGAPLLPDDDEDSLRSGLGSTWSKLKGLVSRKKPRFDDDDDI
jgi:serine/threonine-protein kinase